MDAEEIVYYPLPATKAQGQSRGQRQQQQQTAEQTAGALRGYVISLMHENKDNDAVFTSALGRKYIPLVSDKPPIYQEERRREIKENRKSKIKNAMTSAERRESGLFQLPRKGLVYEDFLPLNSLWQQYLQDPAAGIDFAARNATQLAQKLVKIDLHGAFITVTRSKVPHHVGKSGIILYESQETFQIITMENRCVTIPKRGSIFIVQDKPLLREQPIAESHEDVMTTTPEGDKPTFAITIYGDHFAYRSFDRAVRKFKLLGPITIR